jgi:Brp/Blh family beta-carotene 15,15'-monooxygenase
MHSMIVILLIGFLLLLQATGLQLPFLLLAAGLAVGVLLIGLPHGGLDQKIGLRLLEEFPPVVGLTIFLASYLTLAAIVVAGWIIAPLLTVLAFFSLAAWHFGLEEESRNQFSLLQRLSVFARGGMVIWIPAYFQGPAVTSLLTLILPSGDSSIAGQVVSVISICSPVLFALLAFDIVSAGGLSQRAVAGLSQKQLHRFRVVAFAILFASADPLISFGVYFCGWHSVCGLAHLRDQFQYSNRELALNLMPISLLAIAIFGVGFAVSSSVNLLAPALVQTVFIGLSAVAVPHLLLHIITDSIGMNVQGSVS